MNIGFTNALVANKTTDIHVFADGCDLFRQHIADCDAFILKKFLFQKSRVSVSVNKEDVPEETVAKEKEILMAQAVNEGKPQNIAEKMVNGRIAKYYKEVCITEQPFIKDGDKTVSALTKEVADKIGTTIEIVAFARFEKGEGLEKREDDFAGEIEKMLK